MTTPPIVYSCRDGIAHIQLSNPAGGNVFDLSMISALSAAIKGIDATSARVVLMTAEGRNFSLGGDLNGMRAAEDKAALLNSMAIALNDGLKALEALGLPVVTAVNGAAAGAGLSLAIAGDVVIGGVSSSYLMAYSSIGLSPDGGATYYLPRLIGMRLTQEMAFLNRRLTANEALSAGLITRVVADEALVAEAEAVAWELAAGPTFALRHIKAMLAKSHTTLLDGQLDQEAHAISACAGTADAAEGIEAFLGRRKARFKGK